ncbi:hypothetical protein TcBrA4_0042560 [Trypanosoma cruzi]|nr:hypothetical protein TcBrA4_0042560 [Trypanosoma cruzi]
MSYDDYCAALVERLAGRVGRVLGRRVDGFSGVLLLKLQLRQRYRRGGSLGFVPFILLGDPEVLPATELSSWCSPWMT